MRVSKSQKARFLKIWSSKSALFGRFRWLFPQRTTHKARAVQLCVSKEYLSYKSIRFRVEYPILVSVYIVVVEAQIEGNSKLFCRGNNI
ncbi:hypothetical protein EON65_50165 [archaeon]|nr:MAG: hypothetical protein EON65_50165 [archaeon]